jgi:hypothetical protein
LPDDYSRFIPGKAEACNKNIKYELSKQQYFLTVQAAGSAVGKWVNNYNCQRTRQGTGGLLVPAGRFHGQADQVLSSSGRDIDIAREKLDIERSIFNPVLNSHGDGI